MQMKFKSITFIAVLLSCISANVFAQKWADAIELHQKKIDFLQNQIITSNERILALNSTNFISTRQDTHDLQALINDHLQAVSPMLTNMQIQQMLFELISSPAQITKAKKLLQVRQSQLFKELSMRVSSIEALSKFSKDNETTRYIFEARDLVKSTQEMINANFKY